MKKLIFLPFILLSLAGCNQTQVVTSTKLGAVNIPSQYYRCPKPNIPVGQKIMESDVARYLTQLKQARDTCALSIDSIRQWVKAYNDSIN